MYNACSEGVNAVSKISEVQKELDTMKKLNEELFQSIGTLEQRLNCVLRPISPTEGKTPTKSPMTPLANAIQTENEKISSAISYIKSIQERLEI